MSDVLKLFVQGRFLFKKYFSKANFSSFFWFIFLGLSCLDWGLFLPKIIFFILFGIKVWKWSWWNKFVQCHRWCSVIGSSLLFVCQLCLLYLTSPLHKGVKKQILYPLNQKTNIACSHFFWSKYPFLWLKIYNFCSRDPPLFLWPWLSGK